MEAASSMENVTHLEEDASQEKSDPLAQSDSNVVKLVDSDLGICDNYEVKATNFQDVGAEFCDTNVEQQVALANKKIMEKFNNQLHVSVRSKQPVDNVTAYKLDQPHV